MLHNIAIRRRDYIDPRKEDALGNEDDSEHEILSDEAATTAGKAVRDFYAVTYFSGRH